MKQGKRTLCFFPLPLFLLAAYLCFMLARALPVAEGEKRLPEQTPGIALPDVTLREDAFFEGVFEEPEGVDFPVCRMLYRDLPEKGRSAYRTLYHAALAHRETVYLPLMTAQELGSVHAALKYDNPHLLCVSDAFSYGSLGALFYVKMQYDYTKSECEALRAAMLSSARGICAECAGRTDYERERYIHDTLIRQTDYAETGLNVNNAAGPLVDGRGVCAGYALAMKLMCDVTGLESCIVRGSAENESGTQAHAWLVLRLGGRWYHVDPTWDDPVNEYSRNQLTHAYFNLPTDWISADHTGFSLPEDVVCDSMADNYYVRAGLLCDTNDWRGAVKTRLEAALPELPVEIELRFSQTAQFDEVYGELMDGAINRMMNELIRANRFPIERWRVSVQTFRAMNCLHLTIEEDVD